MANVNQRLNGCRCGPRNPSTDADRRIYADALRMGYSQLEAMDMVLAGKGPTKPHRKGK